MKKILIVIAILIAGGICFFVIKNQFTDNEDAIKLAEEAGRTVASSPSEETQSPIVKTITTAVKKLTTAIAVNTGGWEKKIPNFTVLKTKQPKPYREAATANTISAATGGEVFLYDPSGITVRLAVPAGGLSKDTTITISPLLEVPIENYTSKLGHGVLIEPEGLKFLKNATLTFDFKPGVYSPEGNKRQPSSVLNTLPQKAGIVHIDSIQGRVSNAYAERSQYGSLLFASIGSLSSFMPDDLFGGNGTAVAESQMEMAAMDKQMCSQQFIDAGLKIVEEAQYEGDDETAAGVWSVLQDCATKVVDEMESRCKENPMQVRRRDIVNAKQLIDHIGKLEDLARVDQLMTDCKREYTISAVRTVGVEGGTSIYTIDAKLCGYIDEKWKGQEVSDYTLIVAHDRYDGDITFKLPWAGGEFDMTTSGALVAQSPYTEDIIAPFTGQGQLATYDGGKKITVHYQGFGDFEVEAPIIVGTNKCETTDEEIYQQTGW